MRREQLEALAVRRGRRGEHHRPQRDHRRHAEPAEFVERRDQRVVRIDFEHALPALRPEAEQMLERRARGPGIDIAAPDQRPAGHHLPFEQVEIARWFDQPGRVREEGGEVRETRAVRQGRDRDEQHARNHRGHRHRCALVAPHAQRQPAQEGGQRKRCEREDRRAVTREQDADQCREQEGHAHRTRRRFGEATDQKPRHHRDREGRLVIIAADPHQPVAILRPFGQIERQRQRLKDEQGQERNHRPAQEPRVGIAAQRLEHRDHDDDHIGIFDRHVDPAGRIAIERGAEQREHDQRVDGQQPFERQIGRPHHKEQPEPGHPDRQQGIARKPPRERLEHIKVICARRVAHPQRHHDERTRDAARPPRRDDERDEQHRRHRQQNAEPERRAVR